MGTNELQIICDFLSRASCPEEVFGDLGINAVDQEMRLKNSFRKLAKALHPDHNGNDAVATEIATKWFNELERMKSFAEEAIKGGYYGKYEHRFPWKVPVLVKGKYIIETLLTVGDIADLHISSIESSGKNATTLLKIARNQCDNDLLLAEKNNLERLRDKMKSKGAKDWPQTIPEITDSFLLDDGKSKRRVNVMVPFDGFFTVEEIKKRIPKGIDGRTVVWMWKRLLVLMEWINKSGLTHGALLPHHVMFFPDNGSAAKDIRKHSIRVVDWCYSVDYKTRTRLSAWVPKYQDFYPPEIIDKEPLGGYTDLYMGAMTMLYLIGQDIAEVKATGKVKVPKDVPKSLISSIASCIAKPHAKRPQHIGKYFEEFDALAKKEYGLPKYHRFEIPGI